MKTYFLNLNYKNYNRKDLWVVLPDLAVSCQNSMTAGFGNLPRLIISTVLQCHRQHHDDALQTSTCNYNHHVCKQG